VGANSKRGPASWYEATLTHVVLHDLQRDGAAFGTGNGMALDKLTVFYFKSAPNLAWLNELVFLRCHTVH
jgi:hypothetical protein